MFEPFFTTKERGTGLGLAIAATIVEQHGGTLTGSNNPDKGMTFRLELPFQRPTSAAAVSSSAKGADLTPPDSSGIRDARAARPAVAVLRQVPKK
jgi:hypothetical protein